MKTTPIALTLILICTSVLAQEPLIVAHRGASRDAPENTIPAFELAWKQGADAIEGDFHLTQDGKIVCIHDGNTKKVAGKNLDVKQSTYSQLRALDVGAYKGQKFKGTTIPTLADVFATIPKEKKIYIEVKCGVEIIPTLLSEIDKSKLQREQIVVISFNKHVVKELKAKRPQIKANWLSGFKKDKAGNPSPSIATVLATLKDIKADGFSSSSNGMDGDYIRRVQDAGYEYHVWTVDNAEVARRFDQWGAKSITTNVPGYIRRELAAQPAGS